MSFPEVRKHKKRIIIGFLLLIPVIIAIQFYQYSNNPFDESETVTIIGLDYPCYNNDFDLDKVIKPCRINQTLIDYIDERVIQVISYGYDQTLEMNILEGETLTIDYELSINRKITFTEEFKDAISNIMMSRLSEFDNVQATYNNSGAIISWEYDYYDRPTPRDELKF